MCHFPASYVTLPECSVNRIRLCHFQIQCFQRIGTLEKTPTGHERDWGISLGSETPNLPLSFHVLLGTKAKLTNWEKNTVRTYKLKSKGIPLIYTENPTHKIQRIKLTVTRRDSPSKGRSGMFHRFTLEVGWQQLIQVKTVVFGRGFETTKCLNWLIPNLCRIHDYLRNKFLKERIRLLIFKLLRVFNVILISFFPTPTGKFNMEAEDRKSTLLPCRTSGWIRNRLSLRFFFFMEKLSIKTIDSSLPRFFFSPKALISIDARPASASIMESLPPRLPLLGWPWPPADWPLLGWPWPPADCRPCWLAPQPMAENNAVDHGSSP